MRILANYGYKDNGNSYNVSFETLGDVPLDKTVDTVNELFRLAKQAVLKQVELNGSAPVTEKDPAEALVVPANPKEITVNGNGNIKIKDPTQPASPKQISLIRRLAKQKHMEIETNALNKLQASQLIDTLING